MRRASRRIVRGSQKTARLIDQLLCLARMRSGRAIPLVLRETDLCWVVETALEDHDAQGRLMTVTADGDTVGSWDTDRLVQTADNLIGNALRHGDPQVPWGRGGLGLGLYIVQTFVDAHGGHVPVVSAAEQGTSSAPIPRRLLIGGC